MLASPLPLPWLIKMTGERFIFPFYHLVAENTPAYIRNLYSGVTPEQFQKDLEFLLKNYHPAGSREVKEFVIKGKKCTKPSFFLSFDDGLRSCYEVVYPILKKYGIEAAFFVNTGFVDNQSLFYRFKASLLIDVLRNPENQNVMELLRVLRENSGYPGNNPMAYLASLGPEKTDLLNLLGSAAGLDFNAVLRGEKPYMSFEQLKVLASEGFTIGSHSVDHPPFTGLKLSEQIRQFEESLKYVRDNFKQDVLMFAFPFTDAGIGPDFFEYIHASEVLDVSFGTAGLKRDEAEKHIQRIPMEVSGMHGGKRIIHSEYAWYMVKSPFGKNLLRHKKGIG